jgi:hypothetical protein
MKLNPLKGVSKGQALLNEAASANELSPGKTSRLGKNIVEENMA